MKRHKFRVIPGGLASPVKKPSLQEIQEMLLYIKKYGDEEHLETIHFVIERCFLMTEAMILNSDMEGKNR